jgi:hypothetical protein
MVWAANFRTDVIGCDMIISIGIFSPQKGSAGCLDVDHEPMLRTSELICTYSRMWLLEAIALRDGIDDHPL